MCIKLTSRLILISLLLLSGSSFCENDKVIDLRVDGNGREIKYSTPESFIYDENSGCYFISNINGSPLTEDDNGFIIKLDSGLILIDNYFIDGRDTACVLNAPKGMAVYDNHLYVTDINTVRVFSVANGKHITDVDFSGFKTSFLNDPAVGKEGRVFVSDMMAGAVFAIDRDYKVTKLASIPSPNGLYYHPDNYLLIAHWQPGKIMKLDLDGKSEDFVADRSFGSLDGIDVADDGEIYFSDYKMGIVYKYSPGTKNPVKILTGLKSPADISLDKKHRLILIPQFDAYAIVCKY